MLVGGGAKICKEASTALHMWLTSRFELRSLTIMVFLILLLVPCIPALLGFFFKGRITKKEFALQVGVQVVLAVGMAFFIHHQSMHDVELWNGYVTSKQSHHVSCEHSYQCHCHDVCDSKGKCREECDTCYEHSYDVDWDVYTSNSETIAIDRIDRQGTLEPPRYASVVFGEPTTVAHSYKNYIKASPDSLFRHQGLIEKYQRFIPSYPNQVYDYYHADKFVTVGFRMDDRNWDIALEKLNAEVGRPKQANIIVVVVRNQPQEYFYALEEAWIGGKKNDTILVIGVDDHLVPQWATVMCWTSQEIFKVRLRDDIMAEGGPLDRMKVMADLQKDVTQYYVRKPMAEFQYLEASITPTSGQWVGTIVVGLIISVILTIVTTKYDLFGEDRWSRIARQNQGFGRFPPLMADRNLDAYEKSLRSPFWRRKW